MTPGRSTEARKHSYLELCKHLLLKSRLENARMKRMTLYACAERPLIVCSETLGDFKDFLACFPGAFIGESDRFSLFIIRFTLNFYKQHDPFL